MKRLITHLLVLSLVSTSLLYAAGTREDVLPMDPDVLSGQLENGMEYFVRSHSWPEDRVVLRLIVNAGSVQEEEHELGLAHFVEHMAFNGTAEFPEGELVAFLETLGIRFGPDVNAYTSFDETVYKLDLPSDDPDSLSRGFRVLQQWASAITFAPEQIESERGVIVEEWRRGRGAQARILDQHIPMLLQDSLYATRLPIGDMDIVRSASRDDLIGYFNRWYRPDNMAVVVVGDLPAEQLRGLVHRYLGEISPSPGPLARNHPEVPRISDTRVSIAADPEATRSTVALYVPGDPLPFRTRDDYRQLLVRSLFASVVNERIREIARDPEAPILSGGVGWSRFVRDTEMTIASATARDGMVTEALQVLEEQIEIARRFGIMESELDRARQRFMQFIEDAFVNRRNQPSTALADELVRHWTRGEPVPGITVEYELYRELLPGITAEEVGAAVNFFDGAAGRMVLVGLRDEGEAIPSEAELLGVLDAVAHAELAPPEPEEAGIALFPVPPEGGQIVAETNHEEVETVEFLLENGLRVFVRETAFRDDEILMSATIPGGMLNLPDDLVTAARLAPLVQQESGLGPVSASGLQRLLSGSSAQLTPRIGYTSAGLEGSSRRGDVETLFQMIALTLRDPRFDQNGLQTVQRRSLQSISGALASPQGQFSRRFQALYGAGDPRLGPLEARDVEQVTLEHVRTAFESQFAQLDQMGIFVVGSISPGEVADLAERYLAALPPFPPHEVTIPLDAVTPTKTYSPQGQRERLRAGSEPVAQVGMIFTAPYSWSRQENHRHNSMSDALAIRLREVIREEAGGTYGVGAAGWRWRQPEERSFVQVFFGMDPERSEELIARTIEVIEEFRTSPISESLLERVQAQQRQSHRQAVQENGYWLSNLQFAWENQREFSTILDYLDMVEGLTAEDIRRMAETYLIPESRMELLLLPEEG